MSTYRTCEPQIHDLMIRVMKKHHPELIEAGVTVTCLWAEAKRDKNGQPKGPALKHHGVPAAGLVQINSTKKRIQGHDDATIELDGDEWPGWSKNKQEALLHHELTHLEVKRDKEGNIVLDEANRPKLKMRLHSLEIGIFDRTIAVYGADCIDAENLGEASRKFRQTQLLFPEDLKIAQEA